MANPIIKIKRGSTTPANLSAGELAIDLTNLNLFVGKADGSVLTVGGEGTFATKAYADSAVSSANSSLTAAIAAEEAARIAADNTLDGKITTEKGRIDAILDAADADKDTFAEIVALINSVDTENDQAFAGYVLSNNAALAQEVSDRQAGDSALGVRIDGVESAATALEARVTNAEADLISEINSRTAADTTLQSNIDAEASARSTADTSLSNRIDSLEAASADSRLDDLEADVADHETRISALETTIDGGVY